MLANRLGELISLSGEIDSDFKLGPIELVGIQPTLFCNLNCSYCFLSADDRKSKKRMSLELVEQISERLFSSGLVQGTFTISWAASEPLSVSREFYEKAFVAIEKYNATKTKIIHAFTTNATLITEEWCDFFCKHEIYLAVSVDGPAFLHDRCRRTWDNKGTHQRAVEGIRLLKKYNFPFACITVLSNESLDYPDEIYDFFSSEGIGGTAFNFDEADGVNPHSSMNHPEIASRFENFLSRFYDIVNQDNSNFWVREFDKEKAIFSPAEMNKFEHSRQGYIPPNNQCIIPFALLNIDYDGNFSTFTPELLGAKHHHYQNFYFGRIQDGPIQDVVYTDKFREIWRDIAAGVRACEKKCPQYGFCGGGSPSNKYIENGTFNSTETLHCRLHTKIRSKVVQQKVLGTQQIINRSHYE